MCSSMLFAFVSLPANFFSHSRLFSPHSLRVWSLLGWSELLSRADALLADLRWKLNCLPSGNKRVRVQSLLVNFDTMIMI